MAVIVWLVLTPLGLLLPTLAHTNPFTVQGVMLPVAAGGVLLALLLALAEAAGHRHSTAATAPPSPNRWRAPRPPRGHLVTPPRSPLEVAELLTESYCVLAAKKPAAQIDRPPEVGGRDRPAMTSLTSY